MPFDAQPVLQGERLELRPLRAEDWQALYAVASDSLIWEQHPARNRHEIEVFRTFFDEALAAAARWSSSIAPTAWSSARRGFTATMRRSPRSRSGGRSSPGSTGAASTTAR